MTGPLLASYIALWVVVGVLLIAVFALYHHFGEMYLNSSEGRDELGPKVNTTLRKVEVEDLEGNGFPIPQLGAPAIFLFTSTKCPLCNKLRPDLSQFVLAHPDLTTMVICAGEREAVREWARDLHPSIRVVADPGHRIALRYDVSTMPFCVGIDRRATVRIAGLVNTRRGLEEAAELTLSPTRDEMVHAAQPMELQESVR